MELYLQFGHGMMEHCRHLVKRWNGGTVILSPRDLTSEQMQRLGSEILNREGSILVDPQFYDPRSDHDRLVNQDYWPSEYDTSMLEGGPALVHLLSTLLDLNNSAQADKFIIPGLYAERVDDDWLAVQETVVGEAANLITDRPRLATVCLSGEVLRFEEQTEIILNAAESWPVDGIYLVPDHPGAQYLVEDPMWLGNLAVLCSGLKLQGKEVIVGYSNHQMIYLAVAQVDAIASGTWLNVRSFPLRKFHKDGSDDFSRRAKWYYCPQALTEFKIPFLDIAHRFNELELLRSEPTLASTYADVLFSGAQPTSTGYSEQSSHRHYLHCLQRQCHIASQSTYASTLQSHLDLLDRAEALLRKLHAIGVRGQDRDFGNIIDVNRAALTTLNHVRGFVLKRTWQ